MEQIDKHECPGVKTGFNVELGWFLENHGDGWYMYNRKGERSTSQYNFCPICGVELEEVSSDAE